MGPGADRLVRRRATHADVAALTVLNRHLLEDEGNASRPDDERLADRMRSWIDGSYVVELFEIEGLPVAYAVWRDDDAVHLRQLFVGRAHRRAGIGRRCVELLTAGWGDRDVTIEVLTRNDRALAFWRTLGFSDHSVTLRRRARDLEATSRRSAFTLRPPTIADVAAVAVIAGDPRTSEHLPAGAMTELDAVERLVERWTRDWATHRIGYSMIVVPSGDVVGWAGVRLVERPGFTYFNLAYHVAFEHQGRGLATAAARETVSAARNERPAVALVARVAPENEASVRTAIRLGLSEVARDHRGWPVLASRRLTHDELEALPAA